VWRRRLNASFDREEKLDKGSSKGETENYRRGKTSIAGQASKCQQYALVSLLARLCPCSFDHGGTPDAGNAQPKSLSRPLAINADSF
jgi:hypothetical protein